MKRTLVVVVLILAVSGGSLVFRTASCNAWRDDYKRFIYSETLKNSPVLYGPEEIESIIGEQPAGCDRPDALTPGDIRRFRAEEIGPNYFVDQMRASSGGTSESSAEGASAGALSPERAALWTL